MSTSATPGWYHAQGDPPGTERYWDGTAWTQGPRPVGGVPDVASTETPGGFSTETPSVESPGGFSTETPSVESPGGFSTETPSVESPGGFSTETPGGFSTETPSVQSPPSAPSGAFGAPPTGLPQDGFASPASPMPASGVPQGGFPGAPGAHGPGAIGFYPEESKATTALIVAIVGTVLCGPPGIIGGFMGNSERKAIAEGRRDPAGQGKAMAAIVIGCIAGIFTILAVLAVIAIVVLGTAA